MEFRWVIVLAIYTLLIGPMMDVPFSDAKLKARSHSSKLIRSR